MKNGFRIAQTLCSVTLSVVSCFYQGSIPQNAAGPRTSSVTGSNLAQVQNPEVKTYHGQITAFQVTYRVDIDRYFDDGNENFTVMLHDLSRQSDEKHADNPYIRVATHPGALTSDWRVITYHGYRQSFDGNQSGDVTATHRHFGDWGYSTDPPAHVNNVLPLTLDEINFAMLLADLAKKEVYSNTQVKTE